MALFLAQTGFPAPAHPAETASPGSLSKAQPPLRIQQGGVVLIQTRFKKPVSVVEGVLKGRTVPFFETSTPGLFEGLVGVDLADPPSREELVVTGSMGSSVVERRRFPIRILPGGFTVQELTVPDKFVDLDPATLKRVEEEQKRMLESLNQLSLERYWEGPFILPVEGKISGSFGLRRIMNGQPRSPHSGEDINAPLGAEVGAMNNGVVTLVGEFFFSGKSVILDHGLGLVSMYFHLDEIDVKDGQRVQKGEIIGKVGATGRATGPHLHWGARLNGARINPMSILKVKEGS